MLIYQRVKGTPPWPWLGVNPWYYPARWMVDFVENSMKMDGFIRENMGKTYFLMDDQGYPYDLGNLHFWNSETWGFTHMAKLHCLWSAWTKGTSGGPRSGSAEGKIEIGKIM